MAGKKNGSTRIMLAEHDTKKSGMLLQLNGRGDNLDNLAALYKIRRQLSTTDLFLHKNVLVLLTCVVVWVARYAFGRLQWLVKEGAQPSTDLLLVLWIGVSARSFCRVQSDGFAENYLAVCAGLAAIVRYWCYAK